ncbi:helix-turn-helix domain-containing protein [Kribbella sp. NPDC049584]|uniref:IclR family transcriptional regulator n=1 Tax=Kribbella sp. NPDC049584 TaxID=3154833 RepID=UPI003439615A
MDDHTVTGRAMAILEAVGAGLGPMTLSKLVAETGIPKPSVRRIANRLVDHRILHRESGGYSLGLHLAELGQLAARQLGTAETASPFIHELHQRTRQIAWIGTAGDDGFVMLESSFALRHSQLMAAEWPPPAPPGLFGATAAGQLLLSTRPQLVDLFLQSGPTRLTPYTVTNPQLIVRRLERVAETGLAIEREETRVGWWCGAVVIPGPTTPHILGLTAELHGMSPHRGLRQLQQIADELTCELKST